MSIINLSNRLPTGKAGGLVVANEALLEAGDMWIGSHETEVTNGIGSRLTKIVDEVTGIIKASFAKAVNHYEKYYSSFSNKILWMLLHGIPCEDVCQDDFTAFRRMNKVQAWNMVREVTPETKALVIQDYQEQLTALYTQQLLSNPALFDQSKPRPLVVYYHHVPWIKESDRPNLSAANNAMLDELCLGVLAANRIGVQREEDREEVNAVAVRLCGAIIDGDALIIDGRRVEVAVIPAGMDPKFFIDFEHRGEQPALLKEVGKRQMLFSAERRDPSKGIVEHLEGFERFLDLNPALADKIVYVQAAGETRGNVKAYQEYSKEVQAIVDRINTKHGRNGVLPVLYQDRDIPREELPHFYRKASVMLITSLRDGLNLMAKEFVAAQLKENPGILILSQGVGAIDELRGGCLEVDVSDRKKAADNVARQIAKALNFPAASGCDLSRKELIQRWEASLPKRVERFQRMIHPVLTNTAQKWADRIRKLAGAPRQEQAISNLGLARRVQDARRSVATIK